MKTICCRCQSVIRDDGKPTPPTHTYCPPCLASERRKYGLTGPFNEQPPIAHWLALALLWLIVAALAIIFGCQPVHGAINERELTWNHFAPMVRPCNAVSISLLPVNPSNRVTSPYGTLHHGREHFKSATMKTPCRAHNFNDLSGQAFGRLTVIGLHSIHGNQQKSFWICLCQCGKETQVAGGSLTSGNTRSCGCLKDENKGKALTNGVFAVGNEHLKRVYWRWSAAFNRCYNPKDKRYSDYGGRGLVMCQRWHKFENFLEDMGVNPAGHVLDRINNDGHYEPSNCRWATPRQSNLNTRQNHRLEYDGQNLTISEWAIKLGFNNRLIGQRIQLGWSVKEALTIPAGGRRS